MGFRRIQLGMSLIELMVALLILGIVMLGLSSLVRPSYSAYKWVTDSPPIEENARQALDVISDRLRSALPCTATVQGTINGSVVHEGTATRVGVYRNGTTCGTWVLERVQGELRATSGGSTRVMVRGVTGFGLTYYVSSSYHNTAQTLGTSPTTPLSAADARLISAIRIRLEVANNGQTTRYSTLVRLRNSPPKTN